MAYGYNERKKQIFEFFATRQWVRVPAAAAASGIYPAGGLYGYLNRLHGWGYLHRGKDYKGRIVYKLSPRGASWLMRRRRGAGSVV